MILHIATRELKSLFLSPLAWTILAVIQVILAWIFLVQVETFLTIQPQLAALALQGKDRRAIDAQRYQAHGIGQRDRLRAPRPLVAPLDQVRAGFEPDLRHAVAVGQHRGRQRVDPDRLRPVAGMSLPPFSVPQPSLADRTWRNWAYFRGST